MPESTWLPDLSYMMRVGQLRHIQATRETGALWNPDTLVGRFLSPVQRWSCFWRGRLLLPRLRSDPFYRYVLARTRHYDALLLEAVFAGFERVINVGCGSDTRAYRYGHLLAERGLQVLECDQAPAIEAKRALARRRLPSAPVDHVGIDLNDGAWPDFEVLLESFASDRTLVLIEGVSPYVQASAFEAFLRLLAQRLAPGSRLGYDFKIRGLRDGFGQGGRTAQPFRLSTDAAELQAFHQEVGWRPLRAETSASLTARLLSIPDPTPGSLFDQDALIVAEKGAGR